MERKDIKKPVFMQEAARGRGHMMLLEVMIAVLVFLVGSIAMGIIQVPVMFIYLLSNEEYMSMIMSRQPDMAKIMEIALNIPEWIMIIMLLSEVLLIAVIMLYCRLLEKRKLFTLGFRKKGMAVQYLMGLFFGALAFSAAFLFCLAAGSIRWTGLSDNVVPLYIAGYFLGYMIQGMAEEVLCRGYLFVSLTKRYHVTVSIVVSALFFAALHGMNNQISFFAMINLFLFGVCAALLLLDCENIWIVGAFHSMWNFVQGNLYGIHVSGNKVQNSIFTSENVMGMEVINGGNFGMEGGMSVFVVLVIGIVILMYRLKKKGAIIKWSEQPTPFEQQFNISGSANAGAGQKYGAVKGNANAGTGQNYGAVNGNANAGAEQNYGAVNGNTGQGQNYGPGYGNSGNVNQGYGMEQNQSWQKSTDIPQHKEKPWQSIHQPRQHQNQPQMQQQPVREENIRQTSFDKDYFKD